MKIKKASDLVKITLSYNNKDISISINNFTKLNKVKEKAYQLFYPIKSDIALKFNNKDLSCFLDQSIGLLFENKSKIKLKIEPIIGTYRPIKKIKKIKINLPKNKLDVNSEISKQQLSAERYFSLKTESKNKKINKGKLPLIKNNKSQFDLANELQLDILNFKNCKNCIKNKTNYFCRNCNAFICSYCLNKKHKNHSLLEIDLEDEKLNFEKYRNELINNFNSAINNLDNLDNISNKDISADEWSLIYNKAINQLTNLSKIKFEKIKKSNNNDNNEENKENTYNDFKNKLKEEKNNIKNITISIKEDPFKLFKEINEKEKSVKEIIKQKNKENNEIDDIFNEIENEIDDIIYDLEIQIFSNK